MCLASQRTDLRLQGQTRGTPDPACGTKTRLAGLQYAFPSRRTLVLARPYADEIVRANQRRRSEIDLCRRPLRRYT
jgi:hypothetical protein